MAHPLSRILQEFPTDGSANPELLLRRKFKAVEPVDPQAQSTELKLAEAYATGRADAEAKARADAEQFHLDQMAEFGRQLEAAKQSFSDQLASTLTEDLHQLIDQLTGQMSDQVVAALLPVLRHILTETAIRELAMGVCDLAPDGQTVMIEVSGPEELLRRVEARCAALRGSRPEGMEPLLKFVPCEHFELQARVNDTIIETRLIEWIGKIMEAAG